MPDAPQVIDVRAVTDDIREEWRNFVLTEVNDHVVRVSVMNRGFHWHRHDQSDETFLVIDGELFVDFEGATRTLKPGQMLTVPKGILHRTRAAQRTVSVIVEHREVVVTGDA